MKSLKALNMKLLLAVMTLCLLTGCGGKDNNKEAEGTNVESLEEQQESTNNAADEVTLEGSHETDVEILQGLIEEQRALGADVSEDINDAEQYQWDENGRLVEIAWYEKNLSGEISFHGLTALTELYVNDNSLIAVDVSDCYNLLILYCQHNQLVSLDIKNCRSLYDLLCSYNQLENLDVSDCTNLLEFSCGENLLTKLDVGNCTKLVQLHCQSNQLSTLDVSNCPNLSVLFCSNNVIGSLDLTKCTKLTVLKCSNNHLKELDLSNCPELITLGCYDNQISTLDVSNCTKLDKPEWDDEVSVIRN